MNVAIDELQRVTGEYVSLDGESYYRIANSHLMPDFFMSLVGASDHWMFVSSKGALTAGRCDPDTSLFPYAADDQITVAQASAGPLTLVRDTRLGSIWEPFSASTIASDDVRQSLYKTPLGNKLVFEELNESLGLAFRYRWAFSERFGFVRSCRLENFGSQACSLQLLDGLQNVLPYGVGSDFIMRFSNLANAYKKSELIDGSGVGLFYLSSIPTDRAEPSEGLKTTVAWQWGLDPQATLLSTKQLAAFHRGEPLKTEVDVRGTSGAYLLGQSVELSPGESIQWQIVADLAQDHADVVELDEWLRGSSDPAAAVAADVEAGERDFLRIVSSADALQCGSNARRSNRHLSNTVFNVMRGGVPLDGYRIQRDDFRQHIGGFSRELIERRQAEIDSLPSTLSLQELQTHLESIGDDDLTRLGMEYLPLAFSRRHGDPTRPWNRFAILLRSPTGETNLDYQGNWRDIFQNWEALAMSFPEFTTAMICRFVNATTADGYNPYRLTKGGFEWEEPTPDDPWANIGYWGDHQIIYLLKLLEASRRIDAERMSTLLDARFFVHANVPYRIKEFAEIKRDPQSTIDFDAERAAKIAERVASIGADGRLLRSQSGQIHRVSLLEKLLTLSLAKLSNFVPGGGIWMNTQRPEWNDANNALVGNGLSMVTACYLHRWFRFLHDWIEDLPAEMFSISTEVCDFFRSISDILSQYSASLDAANPSTDRTLITEALSQAGSDYRTMLYEMGPSGEMAELSRAECLRLLATACQHLEVTIRGNRRSDGLYHAYNLLAWSDDGIQIEHLYEMLEGQVAVLSAGLLSPTETIEVLDALRRSDLYRDDQQSYVLYPNRQLPRFLQKNQVSAETVESSPLLLSLLADGNDEIVRRDVRGDVHFNGRFRNVADLRAALEALPDQYQSQAAQEGPQLLEAFEALFGHRQFTGRSGTFFAYEGLGSIYWHMVSKLQLAVAENFFQAVENGAKVEEVGALREHFQSIRKGIGAEKSPENYGAFPSDPYSHSPENAGVKQPGMTGQVKEDILSRFAEIGVEIRDGCLGFRLDLLDRHELLDEPREFRFYNLGGVLETIHVPRHAFAFTLCQVPIVYQAGGDDTIHLRFASGERRSISGTWIDAESSRQLFLRSGQIVGIDCQFKALQ